MQHTMMHWSFGAIGVMHHQVAVYRNLHCVVATRPLLTVSWLVHCRSPNITLDAIGARHDNVVVLVEDRALARTLDALIGTLQ